MALETLFPLGRQGQAVVSASGEYIAIGNTNEIVIRNTNGNVVKTTSLQGASPYANYQIAAISNDAQKAFITTWNGYLTQNGAGGIFEVDLNTGFTRRLDVNQAGATVTYQGWSINADQIDLSADDKYLIFALTDTADSVTWGTQETKIYKKDLQTGILSRIDGAAHGGYSSNPRTNYDASKILFESNLKLAQEPTTNFALYLFDSTQGIILVSKKDDGTVFNSNYGWHADISRDGNLVVFQTGEALDASDTNGVSDVYLKDLRDSSLVKISGNDDGGIYPFVSPDGRHVAYQVYNSTSPCLKLFNIETGQITDLPSVAPKNIGLFTSESIISLGDTGGIFWTWKDYASSDNDNDADYYYFDIGNRQEEQSVIRGYSLYTVVDGPSWTQAEANSVKLGGHLTALSSKAEDDFVFNTLIKRSSTPTDYSDHLWIGLTDGAQEGTYKWSNGEDFIYNNINPINYTETHAEGTQDWVLYWGQSGTWDTQEHEGFPQTGRKGIAEIPFIRRGDSAYVIVEGPSWEEAEENAVKLGGHLATINDEKEHEWIVSTFSDDEHPSLYVGFHQSANGDWIWSDQSSEEGYLNWHPDLPRPGRTPPDRTFGEIILSKLVMTNLDSAGYLHLVSNWSPYSLRGLAEIKLAPNNAPTGTPTLSGNFKVGEVISIDRTPIQDADNFEGWTPTYKYSWEIANDPGLTDVTPVWEALNTADATDDDENLKITDDLTGKLVRGVVSYMDGRGTTEMISTFGTQAILDRPSIESHQILGALNPDNTWNEQLRVETTINSRQPVNATLNATSSGGTLIGVGTEIISITAQHDVAWVPNTYLDDSVIINVGQGATLNSIEVGWNFSAYDPGANPGNDSIEIHGAFWEFDDRHINGNFLSGSSNYIGGDGEDTFSLFSDAAGTYQLYAYDQSEVGYKYAQHSLLYQGPETNDAIWMHLYGIETLTINDVVLRLPDLTPGNYQSNHNLIWQSSEITHLPERTVSISTDLTAKVGQIIEVPITINQAQDLQALDLKFAFDPALFSAPTSGGLVRSGTLTSAWSFSGNVDVVNNILRISGYSSQPLTGQDGDLAYLRLQVKGTAPRGEAVLDLISASLNENTLAVELQDGSLTITAPKVSITSDLKAPVGGSIGIPITIDDASDLQSIDLVFAYDPTIFSLPTSGEIVSGSDLTSNWSFAANTETQGQIKISGYGTTPLEGGKGGLVNLNLKINAGVDTGSVLLDLVSASFNEGAITADLVDGTLKLIPPTFQVMDVRQTASGLALKLSEAPDLEKLNLYDGQDVSVDLPDLRLTRSDGTAVEDLSLHWKAETNELYVIHTDSLTGITQSEFNAGASPFQSDLLAAGDYTLVIDARSDGLISASSGELIDGNGDGITGDAFSYSFTKSTPSNLISIADTARGSGQSLGLNGIAHANGINGLPVLISTSAAIRSLRGTVTYDSTAFNNATLVVGRDLPDDWTLETKEDVIGSLNYTATGTTAITGTDQELFRFDAVVSQDASYGASTLIEATVEAPEDPTLTFESDPSLVALAYSGDTTGNGGHSSLDASLIQRVVVDLDSGFDPYDTLAPTLIGDTTGNGGLSSLDASRVQQEVVGLAVDSFPSIPSDPLA